jgi:hypothetical protein
MPPAPPVGIVGAGATVGGPFGCGGTAVGVDVGTMTGPVGALAVVGVGVGVFFGLGAGVGVEPAGAVVGAAVAVSVGAGVGVIVGVLVGGAGGAPIAVGTYVGGGGGAAPGAAVATTAVAPGVSVAADCAWTPVGLRWVAPAMATRPAATGSSTPADRDRFIQNSSRSCCFSGRLRWDSENWSTGRYRLRDLRLSNGFIISRGPRTVNDGVSALSAALYAGFVSASAQARR